MGRMKTFKELERILLDDGWMLKSVRGSHYQYIHPTKPGKVTIPCHKGDVSPETLKSVLRQAGLL